MLSEKRREKERKRENASQLFLRVQHNLDTKTWQGHYKKKSCTDKSFITMARLDYHRHKY